jgi:hypothetical protein
MGVNAQYIIVLCRAEESSGYMDEWRDNAEATFQLALPEFPFSQQTLERAIDPAEIVRIENNASFIAVAHSIMNCGMNMLISLMITSY